MSNIDALKKLAKKVCSTATDAEINKITTIDGVILLIAEKFDGKSAAQAQTANTSARNTQATPTFPKL